jgi:hypothetical protein
MNGIKGAAFTQKGRDQAKFKSKTWARTALISNVS